jgi:hypothetical protein
MRLKKKYFFVILAVCVFICGLAVYQVFAQNQAVLSPLTFTSSDRGYVFFDHASGNIYVYNSRNGELLSVWQLQRLGSSLVELQ